MIRFPLPLRAIATCVVSLFLFLTVGCTPNSFSPWRIAATTVVPPQKTEPEGPLNLVSVSPNEGPSSGGTTLTLTGTGFRDGMTVAVGDVNCGPLKVISETQATCVTGVVQPRSHIAAVTRLISKTTLPNAFNAFISGWKKLKATPMQEMFGYYAYFTTYQDKIYVFWTGDPYNHAEKIQVSVYSGNDAAISWANVTGMDSLNHNKNARGYSPNAITFNNKMYVSWYEGDGQAIQHQIRVAVYNGNDAAPHWSYVDGDGPNGINHDPLRGAHHGKFAIFNNKLYMITQEYNAVLFNTRQMRVAVYNGNDAAPVWTYVDGDGPNGINEASTNSASYPTLVTLKSKLYASWLEAGQVKVAVYNGNDAAPVWTFVHVPGKTGLNYNMAHSTWFPQVIVFNSKLYIAWLEDESNAYILSHLHVAVYNGNDVAPNWTFVDGGTNEGMNVDPNEPVTIPNLVVFNNRLYISWAENVPGTYWDTNSYIARYNGNDNSPKWTTIPGSAGPGINDHPVSEASAAQMVESHGKLYTFWTETFTIYMCVGK